MIQFFTKSQRVIWCIRKRLRSRIQELVQFEALGSIDSLNRVLDVEGADGAIHMYWDKRSLELSELKFGHFSILCQCRNVEDGSL